MIQNHNVKFWMSSHFCLLVIGFCINLAILPKLQLKKLTQRGVKCSVNLAFEKHSTQSVLNFLSFTASKISLFTKTKKKNMQINNGWFDSLQLHFATYWKIIATLKRLLTFLSGCYGLGIENKTSLLFKIKW